MRVNGWLDRQMVSVEADAAAIVTVRRSSWLYWDRSLLGLPLPHLGRTVDLVASPRAWVPAGAHLLLDDDLLPTTIHLETRNTQRLVVALSSLGYDARTWVSHRDPGLLTDPKTLLQATLAGTNGKSATQECEDLNGHQVLRLSTGGRRIAGLARGVILRERGLLAIGELLGPRVERIPADQIAGVDLRRHGLARVLSIVAGDGQVRKLDVSGSQAEVAAGLIFSRYLSTRG